MCDCCKIEKTWRGNVGRIYVGSKYSPTMYIKEEYGCLYFLVATGEDEGKLVINYCPVCGRKLGE